MDCQQIGNYLFEVALWCALIDIVRKAWRHVHVEIKETAMEDCEFPTLCMCNDRASVMKSPST